MTDRAWILLVYRVPTEPASRRVTIWRDLKRLGALYLQQCVCILPNQDGLSDDVDRITAKLTDMAGEFTRFDLPALSTANEAKIVSSFQALRDKEYAEIIEECETKFVREIEFERFRENYTFEEAEEIGQDLDKIRRWFARVEQRDWFGASGRQLVAEWIDRCQHLLDAFEQDVYQRNGDDAALDSPSPHPLHGEALDIDAAASPVSSERSGTDNDAR